MQHLPTHLPGLGAIRLFAAVIVVLFHVAQKLQTFIYPNGTPAVYLFFVLSGFLICYLFMRERAQTGRIAVGSFLYRRALRILPLYYLAIACVVAIPAIRPDNTMISAAVTFLLPLWRGTPNALAHLWSIGVEEVFYLLLPSLIVLIGIVPTCFSIIGLRLLVDIGLIALPGNGAQSYHIECMAIGALMAWGLLHLPRLRFAVFDTLVAWSAITAGVLSMGTFTPIPVVPLSIVFAIVIANVAFNPRFPKFDLAWAEWGGKRTYGIYVWHTPAIYILLATGIEFAYLPFVILTFTVTVALAALSFQYFERPIIETGRRLSSPLQVYFLRVFSRT